jgi:rhomboid protease GluP
MSPDLSNIHTEEIQIGPLSLAQFLDRATAAAQQLGWKVDVRTAHSLIAQTEASMNSWSETVSLTIEGNRATIQSKSTGNVINDWGKNKKNIESFRAMLRHLLDAPADETQEQPWRESGIREESTEPQPPEIAQSRLPGRENITGIIAAFKPTEGYFITPVLIILNIAIFVAMAVSGVNIMQPDSESLLAWGANFRPYTLDGEWWRLLTCCFLHIGILHLFMNMYALVYIGALVEPLLGRVRFLTTYLLSGIAASVASLYWHEHTVSAGASGAIFGMYGVFLAMLTTNLIDKTTRGPLLSSILFFVGFNLINGVRGGIDNAAHIGGLVSGLLIGYAFYPSLQKPWQSGLTYLSIIVLTAAIIGLSAFVFHRLPKDINVYNQKMTRFVELEKKAVDIYPFPENLPKDSILVRIRKQGIDNWKEGSKVLQEIDKLDIPAADHQRNEKLKQYCRLRIKDYELRYKAIQEDSDQYDAQIENYEQQITALIKQLNEENPKE